MKIEVSNGEIVDKFTILTIKLEKIKDLDKLESIKAEHKAIEKETISIECDYSDYLKLLSVNEKLWNVEDKLRVFEKNKDFGSEFIMLARSVYILNDKRAAIKKKININTKSTLREEKSY